MKIPAKATVVLLMQLSLPVVQAQQPGQVSSVPPAPNQDQLQRIEIAVERQAAKLDALDSRLDKDKEEEREAWKKPSALVALGAVGVSLLSLGFSFWQFKASRADQEKVSAAQLKNSTQSVLLESLKWFGGGIQNRAIGIAIVNGNWHSNRDLRSTWAAILLSQAVYIISKPDPGLPAHELGNLRNILQLLRKVTETTTVNLLGGSVAETLRDAFSQAYQDVPREFKKRKVTQAERSVIQSQLQSVEGDFKMLIHPDNKPSGST